MKWLNQIMLKVIRDHRWLIPIFIYFVVTIVITITGYLYYNQAKKITIERTSSQLQTLNKIKIDEILQWFGERNKDVRFYQQNVNFSDDLKLYLSGNQKDNSKIREWLIQTQQSHDYDIFIVLKNGRQIFLIGNDSIQIAPFIIDSCLSAIKTDKNISPDIYRRPGREDLFYTHIAPLKFSNDTESNACLVFRTRTNIFFKEDTLFDRMFNMNAVYSMVRNEGDSVFIINNKQVKTIKEFPAMKRANDTTPFWKAANGIEGITQGKGFNGKQILASIKKIPDSEWLVVVTIDMDEVQKPLSQGRWMIIGYIILLVFVFIMWHLRFVQKERNRSLHEQLRLNNELINNREILQTIIQSSPLPLIVLSRNNNIIIWNKSAETVFGWTFNDLTESNSNPIFKDTADEEFKLINERLSGVLNSYFFETQRTRKDGKVIDLSCWVSNVVDPVKKENNLLLIFEDITERKLIEKEIKDLNESLEQRVMQRTMEVADLNKSLQERARQLEALNAELESFSYSVSHDLKAPLRSIQGFTDIILQEHSSDLNEEVARLFSIVKKNAKRMDTLIKDLLDLTRVSRADLKYKKINMNELIDEVINSDFENIDKQRIHFNIARLSGSFGDSVLIRQVWQNLISNAIKYSQKKETSVIDINSYIKDSYTVFSIKDNGVGFNPVYSEKLFNIFQRLHNSEEFEGTGVGLAIIKRIINRHGGEVWAESEEEKGATFYFTLPYAVETNTE